MTIEQISDEDLDRAIAVGSCFGEKTEVRIEISRNNLLQILQELKERRDADNKPLDIKGRLQLSRRRCPVVWDRFKTITCPRRYGLVDFWDKKQGICSRNRQDCENCWDKALEGDE